MATLKNLCFNVGFNSFRYYKTLRKLSSLMSQHKIIKAQYPGHILLYQVGDFYEIFGSDAELVASTTSLRTSMRNGTLLAGFPVKSLPAWQKTLLQNGFKLAVCNQTERLDSSGLKGREVVQLITPGTVLEPEDISASYLMSILPGTHDMIGLAWLELSTSQFEVTAINETQLDGHIERILPSEVLLSENLSILLKTGGKGHTFNHTPSSVMTICRSALLKECHVTLIPEAWFLGFNDAKFDSNIHKGVLTELKTGKNYSLLELQAANGILSYVGHTQQSFIPFLKPPVRYSHDSHMTIDVGTRRALELVTPQYTNTKGGTLLGCIDKTVTAGGSRLMKNRLSAPLTKVEGINKRLNVVEYFHQRRFESEWISNLLKSLPDLERLLQKVSIGKATLQDLSLIQNGLHISGLIMNYLNENDGLSICEDLKEELSGVQEFTELSEEIMSAICKETFCIQKGYSTQVDNLLLEIRENEEKAQKLVDSIRNEFQLSKLSLVSHKNLYRVMETTKSQGRAFQTSGKLIKVPSTQSLSRFTTTELQHLNIEHQHAMTEYDKAQNEVHLFLMEEVKERMNELLSTAHGLSVLDVSLSLAQVARENNYCKPTVLSQTHNTEPVYNVKGGFHPVLARYTQPVTNDCNMKTHNTWIITGPNMGGKSTFLRQNALLLILAQMGSFVPAESATISVADKVFARIGASDNLIKHMSTFYTEMIDINNIITNATPNSFVILDEIGRGTANEEGLAIAQAIIEYIHEKIGCRILVATHIHELVKLADTFSNCIGCYQSTVATSDDCNSPIILTYKIEPGRSHSSFGIETAAKAGLLPEIIERAKVLVQEGKKQ